MKHLTWFYLGTVLARKMTGGEETATDKLLKAIAFKNEVLDHDGVIRKGMNPPPRELGRQQLEMEKELERQRQTAVRQEEGIIQRCNQPGWRGHFWKGYYGR